MTTNLSGNLSGKPVKVGLMSFAHGHAYSYIDSLRTIPGVTIGGIYDDDEARGLLAVQQKATTFFATAEALLAQGLDAVIICAENAKHRAMVELAAGHVQAIL